MEEERTSKWIKESVKFREFPFQYPFLETETHEQDFSAGSGEIPFWDWFLLRSSKIFKISRNAESSFLPEARHQGSLLQVGDRS